MPEENLIENEAPVSPEEIEAREELESAPIEAEDALALEEEAGEILPEEAGDSLQFPANA